MKKIIAFGAILLVAAVLVVGCDKDSSSTGPSKYESSLNLVKVENWVTLEASKDDQEIIAESWHYSKKVRAIFSAQIAELREHADFWKSAGLSGYELRKTFSGTLIMKVGGLIPDLMEQTESREGQEFFYAIYIAVEEGVSLEDMRFAFLTEGKYMRPADKDSLETHGYFKGIEKLAKSSAY
ncbi:hypothetical protein [Prosthecochloris sp. GSB1]|uniref:hypothetical protein n=1 Tax=Prosthecochloris sp. GSB1 TaxID=281093 RepID=UPI00123780D1|nr:hypothetical protein [Prosthecochloris sp. GSB1]